MKRLTTTPMPSSHARAFASPFKELRRFYERRKMASLAILVCVSGIFALNAPFSYAVYLIAAGAAALIFLITRRFFRSPLLPLILFTLLFSALFAFRNLPQENLPEGKGTLTGIVSKSPVFQEDKHRVVLTLTDAAMEGSDLNTDVYMYLYGLPDKDFASYGQRVSISDAKVWIPDGVTNPYGFDFARYLRKNGISLCASASAYSLKAFETRSSLQRYLYTVRDAIGRSIDEMYPENSDVMRALLIGDRSLLSDETYANFQKSGISHLIALSGLHVSCIAYMIEMLLKLFLLKPRARRAITVVILTFYALMTGMSPSIVRAVLMYAMAALALSFGYPSDLLTRLSAAFLLQTTYNPLVLLDIGFQLSYACILSIALLSQPMDRLMEKKPLAHIPAFLKESLKISLAVQLGTLPLVAMHFHSLPLLSIPVNMLAVPLGLASVYAGALSAMLHAPLPAIAHAVSIIPDLIWTLLKRFMEFVASLPFADLSARTWPLFAVIAYFICFWLLSPHQKMNAKLRALCASSLILSAAIGMYLPLDRNHALRVTFLDAGYADSAVIDAKGRCYVMDAGKDNSICADYLSASGADVRGIFLSHPDIDHAGGVIEILDRFENAKVYLPECWSRMEIGEGVAKALENADIEYLCAGDSIRLADRIKLEVLWPPEGFSPESDNDGSLVARVTYNEASVMFTGDITDAHDSEIKADCDILKIAHHGSKFATTEIFLANTTPEIAVISVSGNGYGHPTNEVLARLAAVGAQVYRTDTGGAITIDINAAGEIRATEFLAAERQETK